MQIADKKEFGMNEIFCFIFLNVRHFYKLKSFFYKNTLTTFTQLIKIPFDLFNRAFTTLILPCDCVVFCLAMYIPRERVWF